MFVLGENSSLMYIGGEPLMRFWPVGGGHIFNMLDILDNRPCTRAVTKLCSELRLLRSEREFSNHGELQLMNLNQVTMALFLQPLNSTYGLQTFLGASVTRFSEQNVTNILLMFQRHLMLLAVSISHPQLIEPMQRMKKQQMLPSHKGKVLMRKRVNKWKREC